MEDHVCNLTQQGTAGVPPDSDVVNTRQSTELPTEQHSQLSYSPIPDSSQSIELGTIPPDNNNIMPTTDSISSSHQIGTPLQITQLCQHTQDSAITVPTQITQPTRLFFGLFAGHSAPLSCAAKQANIDHFSPFDIEMDPIYNILNDDHFENLLKLAHSGLIGAILSAPPCRLYSSLRKNDGGPPPLRSKDFLDGLPSVTPAQLLQVQESKEIHRRSDLLCIAVFQQGGFVGKEQPINSLAWKEPSNQQFVSQCSFYMVATPACKWGLDIFKTWAIAATSDKISILAGQCQHRDHMDFRGKRLRDGTFVSSLTAEYPSSPASAIVDILKPWVSQSSCFNQDLSLWRNLLSRNPISPGHRITDGAGDRSSANWTIPLSTDTMQPIRQKWIKRILQKQLHLRFAESCKNQQSEPFISDDDITPFFQDINSFPSHSFDLTILPHQPCRPKLFHSLLLLSNDADPDIANLLQEGIPSGAFSKLEAAGLWEPNTKPQEEPPDLSVCKDNWMSANKDPVITEQLIQKELADGFIEEIPSIADAEKRWKQGIALGKLGVVHADNGDPRLVLDSTICGMNGRCHLPEKQRLPNLRHVSFFLSTCPPLQEEWQGASIDIKAAHKRMLIKEDERGSLLFKFGNRLYAYRTAHFGAKTSAWHWGRVSAALMRLLHCLLYFRHAAWVYVDAFLFLFPRSTASIQFALSIILLRVIGAPLSWKKLEFNSNIEWNGWSIQP